MFKGLTWPLTIKTHHVIGSINQVILDHVRWTYVYNDKHRDYLVKFEFEYVFLCCLADVCFFCICVTYSWNIVFMFYFHQQCVLQSYTRHRSISYIFDVFFIWNIHIRLYKCSIMMLCVKIPNPEFWCLFIGRSIYHSQRFSNKWKLTVMTYNFIIKVFIDMIGRLNVYRPIHQTKNMQLKHLRWLKIRFFEIWYNL